MVFSRIWVGVHSGCFQKAGGALYAFLSTEKGDHFSFCGWSPDPRMMPTCGNHKALWMPAGQATKGPVPANPDTRPASHRIGDEFEHLPARALQLHFPARPMQQSTKEDLRHFQGRVPCVLVGGRLMDSCPWYRQLFTGNTMMCRHPAQAAFARGWMGSVSPGCFSPSSKARTAGRWERFEGVICTVGLPGTRPHPIVQSKRDARNPSGVCGIFRDTTVCRLSRCVSVPCFESAL